MKVEEVNVNKMQTYYFESHEKYLFQIVHMLYASSFDKHMHAGTRYFHHRREGGECEARGLFESASNGGKCE